MLTSLTNVGAITSSIMCPPAPQMHPSTPSWPLPLISHDELVWTDGPCPPHQTSYLQPELQALVGCPVDGGLEVASAHRCEAAGVVHGNVTAAGGTHRRQSVTKLRGSAIAVSVAAQLHATCITYLNVFLSIACCEDKSVKNESCM